MKMLQFSRTLLSIGADRGIYLKGLADKPGNGNVNCSGKTNRRYQMGTISILFPNQIFYCCSFYWFDNASARIGSDTFHSKPLDFRFYRCALFCLWLFYDICLFDLSSFSLIFWLCTSFAMILDLRIVYIAKNVLAYILRQSVKDVNVPSLPAARRRSVIWYESCKWLCVSANLFWKN